MNRSVPADVGTVEPGTLADVVVFGTNPLDVISALREVEATYKASKQVA